MAGTVQKLLTIVAVALAACFGHSGNCLAQGPPSSEEYSVYAALFRDKSADEQHVQLVIADQTAIDHFFSQPASDDLGIQTLIKELPQLEKETAVDFLSKNRTSWTLKNEFKLNAEIILITTDERKNFFKGYIDDGWKLFHTKYPRAGSIDTLSRVGFNQEKTQALIYYGYTCGGLCGQGQYIQFTRKEDRWTIQKEWMTWIS